MKGNFRHYYIKNWLMNSNEYKLFNLLEKIDFPFDARVIPQVHLDEISKPSAFRWVRNRLFRFINRKSVDFVIFDRKGMHPKLAIELDGYSHNNNHTKIIDSKKQDLLDEINLPLLRIKNSEYYDQAVLKDQIISKLNTEKEF